MAELTTTVKQVLNRKGAKVFSVSPETSVFDALKLMADHDIGAVLVTQSEELVGIFTERDYARKLVLKGISSKEAKVGEIMTSNLFTVSSSDRINDVMMTMSSRRFRHVPVVDGDQLIGIITIGDVVKTVIDEQEETIKHLASYISGDLAN